MTPNDLPMWYSRLHDIAAKALHNSNLFANIATEAIKQKSALSVINQLPTADKNIEILTDNLYKQQLKLKAMLDKLPETIYDL